MVRNKNVRFTLRLVPTLHKKLEDISKIKGMPKNSLIVEALWEYVNSFKKQKLRS